MSLIEKAVQRLEELKRAGVGAEPEADEAPPAPASPARPVAAASPKDAARPAKPAAPEKTAAAPAEAQRGSARAVEIDLTRLAEAGLVTPDAPRSRVADEFRVIKRPLLSNAQGKGPAPIKNGNLIMVTSSLPGEGKSFSSINLAMSIAMELDSTVLLVDADVARPSMLKILGLPPAKGLMDVLSGDRLDLGDVLLRTNVGKLSILPAGTSHQRATELLASEAMNHLLDEMATRYSDRIIIFDSPPLVVTTEARALATHMGQIVLVVEADRTTHGTVKQALATLESCPVVMLMLNKGPYSGGEGYYGYSGYGSYGGYGSGYGSGYGGGAYGS